jgi:hypothetical protein
MKIEKFDQQWKPMFTGGVTTWNCPQCGQEHQRDHIPSLRPATKEEIDEVAYYLWDEAGRPTSDGKEFWYLAETKLKKGVPSKPLYKEEWVGPCSCGKPLGNSPFSYCLDCAKKKDKKEKKSKKE